MKAKIFYTRGTEQDMFIVDDLRDFESFVAGISDVAMRGGFVTDATLGVAFPARSITFIGEVK